MTASEFGDLVLVPFPFTDQSATKRRPAVVVSSAAYHRERPDLVILAVTSQAHPQASFGEAVAKWKEAGPPQALRAQARARRRERRLVLRKLGRLCRRKPRRAAQAAGGDPRRVETQGFDKTSVSCQEPRPSGGGVWPSSLAPLARARGSRAQRAVPAGPSSDLPPCLRLAKALSDKARPYPT